MLAIPQSTAPRPRRLTLPEPYCYGAKRMDGKTRRYLLLLLGVLALGILTYKFRNSFTFEGFSWANVVVSVRHANLGLLVLSLVAIYGCYALRALRWMRFCPFAWRHDNLLETSITRRWWASPAASCSAVLPNPCAPR